MTLFNQIDQINQKQIKQRKHMITLTQKTVNRIKQYQSGKIETHRGRKPFMIPKGVDIDWNKTNREIAEQLNTSPMTILLLRRRLGVPALPKGRPTHESQPSLAELREAMDKLYQQLAKNLK